MAFLNSLDRIASGLSAQKLRLDVITQNITNRETTRTEDGEPYRRKMVIFQSVDGNSFSSVLESKLRVGNSSAGEGVRVSAIVEDQSDLNPVYDPEHPDADDDGYVWMPNVNTTTEMIDALSASRSYNANLTVLEAVKTMAKKISEIR